MESSCHLPSSFATPSSSEVTPIFAFTSTAMAQLGAEEARQRKEVQQVSEVEADIHPNSSSKFT
ncbi:hypothetical protein D9756_010806 [Leucocoprinus leucothites]|uniref:Uncharacterized protein n=1 Tax=Leucocoprinus leucothites TaxID=201217 RepID=A0A8H5FR41_9AGAR|nr:hypothetical protein D9756_010806 [Leucoagaricus leucothites]